MFHGYLGFWRPDTVPTMAGVIQPRIFPILDEQLRLPMLHFQVRPKEDRALLLP
jgi:hypothetical protein